MTEKRYQKSLILLFPICVLIDLFMGFFVAEADSLPFWLDAVGSFLGAAIGGPVYGVIIHVVYDIIHSITSFDIVYTLSLFPTMASIVTFGFLARIGYMKSFRSMWIVTAVVTFVKTVTSTPVTIAITGGHVVDNRLIENFFVMLIKETTLKIPIATLISQGLGELLDCLVVVFLVYLVVHKAWDFWNRNFDVKCMETFKIAVVDKKEDIEE